jgi:hypothetical protein
MLTSLLIYRFVLANGLGVAICLALAWSGHLIPVFETDQSRLTFAIAGLFLVGWAWTLKEAISVSDSLDRSKAHGYRPASVAEADKAMLKVEWLESIPEWLVGLGLLGTVIGFSIALSGIDQSSVMQATGAQNAVAALMSGMRVALNTTLLGAALAIWHQVNLRMLKTAMGCYWIDRVRSGAGEIAARGQD